MRLLVGGGVAGDDHVEEVAHAHAVEQRFGERPGLLVTTPISRPCACTPASLHAPGVNLRNGRYLGVVALEGFDGGMQRVGRRRLVVGQTTLDQYRHALADEAGALGRVRCGAPMSSSINRQASARSAMVSSSVPSRSKVTDWKCISNLGQFAAQRTDDRVVAMRVAILAGAIDGRAGDEGVDAGAGDFGDVGSVHATIDFEADAPAALLFVGIELGAGLPGLGQRARDELLATEAGVDAHQQDDVELVHDVVHVVERRRRVEDQAGLAAAVADQATGCGRCAPTLPGGR